MLLKPFLQPEIWIENAEHEVKSKNALDIFAACQFLCLITLQTMTLSFPMPLSFYSGRRRILTFFFAEHTISFIVCFCKYVAEQQHLTVAAGAENNS